MQDGFFRVRPNATALIAAVQNLQEGEAVSVDYTAVGDHVSGANLWLLNYLIWWVGVTAPFYYDIVRVPDSVWRNSTVSDQALMSYVLDTMGYDCVLGRVQESGSKVRTRHLRYRQPRRRPGVAASHSSATALCAAAQELNANFLHVNTPFTYVVVSTVPMLTPVPVLKASLSNVSRNLTQSTGSRKLKLHSLFSPPAHLRSEC